MALTLDGSAKGTATTASTATATLTTSLTNDVIIAFVEASHPSTTPTISSVSGAGLTWTKRKTFSFTFTANTASKMIVEEWWAPAASALSSQVITVTAGATLDHVSIITFGVNGVANINDPFDPNGGLTVTYNSPDTGGNKNPNVGGSDRPTFSTNNANTIAIGYVASVSSPTQRADTPNSWVSIQENNNSAGTAWSNTTAQYKVFSAAQSATPMSWRDAANNYLILADALTADFTRRKRNVITNQT